MLKFYLPWRKNISNIFRSSPELYKDSNYHIARFISLIIGIQGLVMTFVCLKDSNFTMVLVSIIYGLTMISTFFIVTFTKNLSLFYIFIPLLVIGLEIINLYTGGTSGYGVIWMTMIPLFTIYLLPLAGFITLNSAVLLILILGMWTPLNNYTYDYTKAFESRLPITFAIELIFSFFLKQRIQFTEKELKKQKNLLAQEIQNASTIQATFFNQHNYAFTDWEVAFKNIPMAGVSGDLYDIYPKEDSSSTELSGLGIFDISGHGISSGIITLLAKNIIRQEFYNGREKALWETVQTINDRFILEKGDISNYITGVIVKVNEQNIELVNSGHQKPLLYTKKTESFSFIENSKYAFGAIGLNTVESSYDSLFINMESGDELILYTDGILDCTNPEGNAFGQELLVDFFKAYIEYSPEFQVKELYEDLSDFMNNSPLKDDMTVVILKKK